MVDSLTALAASPLPPALRNFKPMICTFQLTPTTPVASLAVKRCARNVSRGCCRPWIVVAVDEIQPTRSSLYPFRSVVGAVGPAGIAQQVLSVDIAIAVLVGT